MKLCDSFENIFSRVLLITSFYRVLARVSHMTKPGVNGWEVQYFHIKELWNKSYIMLGSE